MKRLILAIAMSMVLVLPMGVLGQTVVLDGVPVGTTNPNTGKFTNLEATTQFKLGSETATSFDGIDSKNVKVSSDDTTPGFLNGKLVQGAGITLTENGGGGNETLSISANDTLTTKGDVLYHNGTSETRLAVGVSGQILTSDSNDNLLWANPPEGGDLFNANVLLNAYRTAENGGRPVLKMIDGVVDAFETETGVDAVVSTNEDYDAANNYYRPANSPITIPAVTFDGTNDYLTISEATLGQSDGKSFTASLWVDMTGSTDGVDHAFIRTTNASLFFAEIQATSWK